MATRGGGRRGVPAAGLVVGIALATATVIVVGRPPVADAVSLSRTAIADTTVAAATPTTPAGSSPILQVDGSPDLRAFLKFDLSGIEGRLVSATLRLRVADLSGAGSTLPGEVAAVPAAWDESLTYQGAQGLTPSAARRPLPAVLRNASLQVDVTALVTLGGMAALALLPLGSDGLDVDSRQAVDPARRPTLSLEVEPLDSTTSSSSTTTTTVTSTTSSTTSSTTAAPTTTAPTPPRTIPDPEGDGVTVVAAGDIACAPGATVTSTKCRHAAIAARVAAEPDLSAVLVLGDLQYGSGTTAEFNGSYDLSWGALRSRTYPAPGNHEYQTAGAAGYFGYFGAAAGPAGKGWYSVDVGASWRLIALNSNCGAVGCGSSSAQMAFFRDALATNPRPCTLAYWHHPRWTSNQDPVKASARMATALSLLDANRAEIVLNGHAHQYERFAQMRADGTLASDGVRHFTAGTGGVGLGQFASVPAPTSRFRASAFGYLRLRLLDAGYTWAFVDEAGRVLDEGSGMCQ
jgi:hypothetical protein